NRALVGVQVREQTAAFARLASSVGRADRRIARLACERCRAGIPGERPEPPRFAALAGRLDLDDLGTKVRQEFPAVFTGHSARHLENAQITQGGHSSHLVPRARDHYPSTRAYPPGWLRGRARLIASSDKNECRAGRGPGSY